MGGRPLKQFKGTEPYFRGKRGLEIGGPSQIFSEASLLPIYRIAASCDNCNFCNTTIWQGSLQEGMTFKYHRRKPAGYQFVCEASSLSGIPDGSYDFVLASHVLEHIANPIKALLEWKRVLRPGGVILIVCPHKEATFDHMRPTTSLSHLIEDYNNGLDEDDLSHMSEILQLHDLSLDPEAGSHEQFAARSQNNFQNRCLHHHVFTTESWVQILDHLELEVVLLTGARPFHIVAIARKVEGDTGSKGALHASNRRLLAIDASWREAIPFRLDKLMDAMTRQVISTGEHVDFSDMCV
jgi:SAM-dependent methyltransferase